ISGGGRGWPAAGSTPVSNLLPGPVYKELRTTIQCLMVQPCWLNLTSPLQDHLCGFPASWWLPEISSMAVICL
ncbi:hypothetical protein AMECASPLE_029833, partial [Ameca splendens]